MKFFNKYSIIARFFPSVLTSLPLVILSGFIIGEDFIALFQNFRYFKIAGLISAPIVLFYFFSYINRFIAKEYFQKKKFKGELEMPTTIYLLTSSKSLSNEYKSSIKEKISEEFNLSFPSKQEEENDLDNSKLRISEAIGLVRNKVGDGNLLLQHNIEYGFIRNLIGGSPIALIFSLANIYIFYYLISSNIAFITSVILSIFYLLLILFSKYLINRFGAIYANRLFQEYMSQK